MTFPNKAYSTNVIYFKFFKKLIKEKDEKYNISIQRYRAIIYLFNKKLIEKLFKGFEVILPYQLGSFRIRKKPLNVNVAKPNIPEYVKTGIKSKYFNEHSDGFRASLYWKKQDCNVAGSYMFSLSLTEGNKRQLGKIMKKKGGHKTFYE